jgi:hypothetical protein
MGLKKREYGDVTGSSIPFVVWGTLVYIKLLTLWPADGLQLFQEKFCSMELDYAYVMT